MIAADWTPAYADADAFRTALTAAGLLHTTRVPGVYHRSQVFEDVVTSIEAYAAAQRVDDTAQRRYFPPVMPRADFLLTDYLRSFPDLTGSVDTFTGDDRAHRALLAALDAGEDWTTHLAPAEVVLSSSICHSLYGTLPHDIGPDGLPAECCGYSFRHEPSPDPMRMQAFRMYEFVLVGTPAQAQAHRDAWLQRAVAALAALELPVHVEVANDPFFGRVGRMLAANQIGAELKFEILVDATEARSTAIASANYHEDHFGTPFGLSTPDGAPAHSACMGFGLERIALALFAVHGLDPAGWPASVTTALT